MEAPRFAIVGALLAAIWLTAVPVRAQGAGSVVTLSADRVTVRADAVPVGDLLAQLAPLASLGRLDLDPAYRSTPVSLVAENVSPFAAIILVLKASGLDYLMSDTQVVAGRGKLALETPGRSANREETVGAPQPAPAVARPADSSDDDRERRSRESVESALAVSAEVGGAAAEPTYGSIPPDAFAVLVGAPDVPFTIKGDSVTVTQPGYVPYKMQPQVVRQRQAVDPATIP